MFDIVVNGGWHLVIHLLVAYVFAVIMGVVAAIAKDEFGNTETYAVFNVLSRMGSYFMAFLMWCITFWILGITFIP